MSHEPVESQRYIPVSKWIDYHPWPTPAGLRFLIFNEQKNGFQTCVIRVGRRILIDESAFFEWVRGHK